MPRCCVIGAGPSGITAAKHLLQVGLRDVVVYDRGRRVGGNWVFDPGPSPSSVFETTHIISSKALSQYSDFPWPAGSGGLPGAPGAPGLLRGIRAPLRRPAPHPLRHRGRPGGARRRGLARHPRGRHGRALRLRARGQRPPLGPPDAGVSRALHGGAHPLPRLQERGSLPGPSRARDRRRELRVRHRGRDVARLRVHRDQHAQGLLLRPQVPLRPALGRAPLEAGVHSAAAPGPPPRSRAPRPERILGALRAAEARPSVPLVAPRRELGAAVFHPARGDPSAAGRRPASRSTSVHFVDGRARGISSGDRGHRLPDQLPLPGPRRSWTSRTAPSPSTSAAFTRGSRASSSSASCSPSAASGPSPSCRASSWPTPSWAATGCPPDLESRIAAETRTTQRTFMHTPRHSTEVDYHPFRKALLDEIPGNAPGWPAGPAPAR